ncbi:MAG: hypothetical protein AAFQ64_18580 [Pseudomonadota bacterium]
MLTKRHRLAALHACAFVAISLASTPTAASANTVTLEAHDGTSAITGTLLSYSEGRHVIDTAIGALTVHASRVSCFGATCPPIDQVQADIEPHCPNDPVPAF